MKELVWNEGETTRHTREAPYWFISGVAIVFKSGISSATVYTGLGWGTPTRDGRDFATLEEAQAYALAIASLEGLI